MEISLANLYLDLVLKGLNKSHKEVATVEVAIRGGMTVFHPG